jgi:hypothetical protein
MKKIGTVSLLTILLVIGFHPDIFAEKKDEFLSCFCCHNDDDKDEHHENKRTRFKGHWAGIEFGFNNYLTPDNSFSLPLNMDYMTINSGKSNNLNLNFYQISVGITKHFGFVTGLGLNWNNYRFDGYNNIQKIDSTGFIGMLDTGDEPLKKSKFGTLYLDMPLLLEIQIPADHNRLHIAVGPIGGVKLFSYSSIVYKNKDKIKSGNDFNLNMLRYGLTARIGWENFHVYGTYYMTPLFKKDMGPEGPAGVNLYPFEIGFAFTIN